MYRLSAIALTVLILTGCETTRYHADSNPEAFTFAKTDDKVVREVRVVKWEHFFIFGLVGPRQRDFAQLVDLKPGEQCTHLQITNQRRFINVVVGLLAAPIWQPRATVITCDVVEKKAPATASEP